MDDTKKFRILIVLFSIIILLSSVVIYTEITTGNNIKTTKNVNDVEGLATIGLEVENPEESEPNEGP